MISHYKDDSENKIKYKPNTTTTVTILVGFAETDPLGFCIIYENQHVSECLQCIWLQSTALRTFRDVYSLEKGVSQPEGSSPASKFQLIPVFLFEL